MCFPSPGRRGFTPSVLPEGAGGEGGARRYENEFGINCESGI